MLDKLTDCLILQKLCDIMIASSKTKQLSWVLRQVITTVQNGSVLGPMPHANYNIFIALNLKEIVKDLIQANQSHFFVQKHLL